MLHKGRILFKEQLLAGFINRNLREKVACGSTESTEMFDLDHSLPGDLAGGINACIAARHRPINV